MRSHKEVLVRLADREYRAHVSADGRVTLGDTEESLSVSRLAPGTYRVDSAGRGTLVFVADQGEHRWVFTAGHTWRLEVGAPNRPPGSRGRVDQDALLAPMPATVSQVLVNEGTVVRAGDILVVLEAMKMELPVRAPRDGRVRSICCRQGELVEPGTALVQLADP